ncbi:C40 family peptidase [Streptomyces sp. WAC 01325]|uniref:C40 family peptidase n=1 Tax=Streptomyces sp. WAC 01325 TaxID=2203202 RepID=UPI0021AF9BED|nr:C40 family peptidase [Streptomyces sp. WAC 01325]
MDDLYHDAEVATDDYNDASEKAEKQSRRVKALRNSIKDVEKRLTQLNAQAGAAARAQYRSGSLPAELHVVLSDHPQGALDSAAQVLQSQQTTATVVKTLQDMRLTLETRKNEATQELERLEQSNTDKRESRQRIQQRIIAARRLEARLDPEQQKELSRVEAIDESKAEQDWIRSGGGGGAVASSAGRKAVSYARSQLGKPYIWGAEGPNSFDCSGLTSQAWAAAGRPIPRTSQTQWAQLPHVALKSIRPGDLVIYFADASHVGIYIGNGHIIHAPRPGRSISEAPASSMKILGVVRPDV